MQGELHIIPTPFLASTTEMAQSILSEPSVKDMLQVASLASYLLLSVLGIISRRYDCKRRKINTT